MQLTILPDKVDRAFAAKVADSTVRQANKPPGDPQHEPVLRELMESWVASGCRPDRWLKANPKQASILRREANRWTLTFAASSKGKLLSILSNHPFVPEGQQRHEQMDSQEYSGYQAFVTFLVCAAPRFDVGKCDRCGGFYWNRWGHTNKCFCGRKCAQIGTATVRQSRKVSKRRREKNARIRLAIETLGPDKQVGGDWKGWVARRARVTRSYITRALNRGVRGGLDGLKLSKGQQSRLDKFTHGGK